MGEFEFGNGGGRMRLDTRTTSVGVWAKDEVVKAVNAHAKLLGGSATRRVFRAALGHADVTRLQPQDYGALMAGITESLTNRPHRWMAGTPRQPDIYALGRPKLPPPKERA